MCVRAVGYVLRKPSSLAGSRRGDRNYHGKARKNNTINLHTEGLFAAFIVDECLLCR